jgi:hypothetical protein
MSDGYARRSTYCDDRWGKEAYGIGGPNIETINRAHQPESWLLAAGEERPPGHAFRLIVPTVGL